MGAGQGCSPRLCESSWPGEGAARRQQGTNSQKPRGSQATSHLPDLPWVARVTLQPRRLAGAEQ